MSLPEDILGISLEKGQPPQATVLVAPLDWGLGHATRCIPLIDYFLEKGMRVLLLGYGRSGAFLKGRYPQLEYREFSGPDIRYAHGILYFFKLPWLVMKYASWSRKEHRKLAPIIAELKPAAIISDARPGLYSKHCHSIIVNSQLNPLLPAGLKWLQWMSARLMAGAMNHFDQVWVPDHAGSKSLLGKLAINPFIRVPVHFIGPLSRFKDLQIEGIREQGHQQILVLLSGPEPNRSSLEQKILQQMAGLSYKFTLVRGLAPGYQKAEPQHRIPNLRIHSFLDGHALAKALGKASLIIARPGYSSLMDLCRFNKKLLLIPTPGQTEQEYLGKRLHNRGWALCVKEGKLQLKEHIPLAMNCAPFTCK